MYFDFVHCLIHCLLMLTHAVLQFLFAVSCFHCTKMIYREIKTVID